MSEPVAPEERPITSVGDLLKADAGELTLQADLAAMSLRDVLSGRLEAAENAWLAARHRLEMAVSDAEKVMEALRAAVSDVMKVVDDVDESIRRSRAAS